MELCSRSPFGLYLPTRECRCPLRIRILSFSLFGGSTAYARVSIFSKDSDSLLHGMCYNLLGF